MGILKVGIKDSVRNKGKTIITVIGILISIILISGINISTASLTTYNIKNSLSDIYVDIDVRSDSNDIDGIMDALEVVKEFDPIIDKILPCYSRPFDEYFGKLLITTNETINWDKIIAESFDKKYFQEFGSLHGVDTSFFSLERFKDTYKIVSGRLPYNDNEILLDHKTFSSLKIDLNDNITIGTYISVELITLNYTISNLKVVGTIRIDDRGALYQFFPYLWYDDNIIITNFDFIQEMHANFSYFPDVYSIGGWGLSLISYNFLINHESLNVFNYDEMVDQLGRIVTRIYVEDKADYDFYVNSDLLWKLRYTKEFMELYRLLLLVISLPVYILGLYLSRTLFSISLDKREKKLGQLLSKGASRRQIYSWIIAESITYSIVGGLLGVLGGYFLSYLIIYSLLGANFGPFLAEIGIIFHPFTIIFSIFIAILFCLIALYKPLKDLSKKSIIVASKSYLDQNESIYKSKRDWILLIMGILPIIFSFILTPKVIQQTPLEVQIILVNVMVFVTGWTVASTFILTYSLVKIITTRYNEKFISFTKSVIKPFSKINYELISRNLSRKTKRTTALIFMISFTFSFLILSAIISESQKRYEQELLYLNIGADIRAFSGHYSEFDEDLEQNLKDFSKDIKEVNPILQFYADSDILSTVGEAYSYYSSYYGFREEIYTISINAIRPDEYLSVCQFREKYFADGSNEDTILKLKNKKNGILVDKNAAEILGLLEGDNLEIQVPLVYGNETELELEIIGFFNILPGLSYYERHLDILMNFEYIEAEYDFLFQQGYNYISYLIDVKDDENVNKAKIARDIEKEFEENIASAITYEEELKNLQDVSSFTSVVDILNIQNLFILFIATCGLLILLYANFSERELEMAVLRARGFERKSLIKINFAEGIILIIYGITVSVLAGYWVLKAFDLCIKYHWEKYEKK